MDMIGIDLGTTNSVATIYNNKDDSLKHILFDNEELLPSVVNISDDGVLVGIASLYTEHFCSMIQFAQDLEK